jgi:ADP-ribose pyrophosphatase YjhB (NUDIX family)
MPIKKDSLLQNQAAREGREEISLKSNRSTRRETEAAAFFETQSRATVPPDGRRVRLVRYRQAKGSPTDRQHLTAASGSHRDSMTGHR